MDDPTTQELRLEQLNRELAEKKRAEEADDANDTAQHDRRAMKAEYLRAKLEERERAEREAAAKDAGD